MTLRTRITTTLIVTAALLSACVSQGTYNQEVQKASTLSAQDKAYQQLSAQLKGEVAADQAQITQLQNFVRVTLANGILFPEGGWELNDAGKATVAKLAPVLKTLTGQKIDIKGCMQVRQKMPEAIAFFILPPNSEEQARRILSRNTDAKEVIEQRLAKADGEIRFANESGCYDYFVVNDHINETVDRIKELIAAKK